MSPELQQRLFAAQPEIFAERVDQGSTLRTYGISCRDGWYALNAMVPGPTSVLSMGYVKALSWTGYTPSAAANRSGALVGRLHP